MSKITSFSPANLGNVRSSMEAALKKVEEEFGIKLQIGKMSYTSDSIAMQVNAMTGADDPMMAGLDPKYVAELKKWANGAPYFMKETTINGVKCTVVGAKPRTRLDEMVVRRSSDNSLKVVPRAMVDKGLTK